MRGRLISREALICFQMVGTRASREGGPGYRPKVSPSAFLIRDPSVGQGQGGWANKAGLSFFLFGGWAANEVSDVGCWPQQVGFSSFGGWAGGTKVGFSFFRGWVGGTGMFFLFPRVGGWHQGRFPSLTDAAECIPQESHVTW